MGLRPQKHEMKTRDVSQYYSCIFDRKRKLKSPREARIIRIFHFNHAWANSPGSPKRGQRGSFSGGSHKRKLPSEPERPTGMIDQNKGNPGGDPFA